VGKNTNGREKKKVKRQATRRTGGGKRGSADSLGTCLNSKKGCGFRSLAGGRTEKGGEGSIVVEGKRAHLRIGRRGLKKFAIPPRKRKTNSQKGAGPSAKTGMEENLWWS